jgi:hypothetical protein
MASSTCRDDEVQRTQLAFALLEPPCQHQRHGDLEDFARLDHHADVEPAPGALLGHAEHRHGHQQADAQQVERDGKAHQPLRRHLRHDEHDRARQQHVAAMVDEAGAVVEPGAVHGEQAGAGQQEHRESQGTVESLQQGDGALPKGRFLEDGGHARLSSALSSDWP